MAWYDDLYGSVGPLGALSLGVGAAGTGFGIWDQYQANQAAQKREHLAEQMMRMGPGAYAPNYSPEQLQSMYFRPASSFMQQQGVTSGGAFQQGLADASLKAEGDRQALGNQIYQARLAALGYGPPPGATGTTGALGQSLQSLMLMQALAGRNRTPDQPGVTAAPIPYAGSAMGGEAGRDRAFPESYDDMSIPNWQFGGGGGTNSWVNPFSDTGYQLQSPGYSLYPSGAY